MVTKSRLPAIVWTAVFCALDVVLCIVCLCGHGHDFAWANFQRQFSERYSFLRSTVDFLFISILRTVFFAAGCAYLCASKNPLRVLTMVSQASFSICILVGSFSPTKLLALHENDNRPFFGDWLVLVENAIFALLGHFLRATADHDPANYERLNGATSREDLEEEEEEDGCFTFPGFTWLFIFSVTKVFVPYYVGQVIASVITTEGDKYAALYAAVKLMVALSIVSTRTRRINRAVRNNLFTSLVNQDVAFFDKHKTGEITSGLTADTQTMSDTVFLRNIVQMGGSMIFMLALSWKLSTVPFIVVPIILVASKIFGVYYDMLSEQTQEAVAHSNDVAEEVLSTMRTVRSFACEDEEVRRFYEKLTFTLHVTKKKAVAYVGFLWVSELFQAVINISVLWYGGHLVLTKQLQKDLLVAFLLYQMQLAENIRQLSEGVDGAYAYIDRKPQIPTDGQYVPEKVTGRIQFENVHFSYPTRKTIPILKNLSFTVEPGEVVALVGPHFYAPSAGRILIDGIPLRDYEHHFIHNTIALVGQEPNISYGLDECKMADVKHAAQLANAHDFIVQTTEGYETNVGEKGSQMSGGQKQRIAIARGCPTSALDTESEHLVQEAIYKNLKGRSVKKKGKSVIECRILLYRLSGESWSRWALHQELLSQEGTYQTLVKRQMIGGGEPTAPQPLPQVPSAARSFNISPRSMAQSLLATSFTQSTTSFQSK
ncbi:ATP-binding cassette sub-family B member 9 [Aphelenchoides fujianensis]|nr:ATP-binding cassette sub-family B member 9 [Aphelenchoides fujianensis]